MPEKRNNVSSGHCDRRRAATADSATLEDQCHPRKVFIGGLAHKTTTQQLRDYFARYGAIVDAVVLRWPDGRSRGFGYVTFSETAGASAALQESHQVGGREVDVKRAVPGTNKLFVGGLPQNVTATELRQHFEAFGVVSDAVVMIDPATNRSRGFGFVCFLPGQEGAAAVSAALEQYENHRIRGKWIEVKSAAPPHKLSPKGQESPTESNSGSLGDLGSPHETPQRKLSKQSTASTSSKKSFTGSKSPKSPNTSSAAPNTTSLQTKNVPIATPNRRDGPKPIPTISNAFEPQKISIAEMASLPPGLGSTAAAAMAAITAMGLPPGLGAPPVSPMLQAVPSATDIFSTMPFAAHWPYSAPWSFAGSRC